MTATRPPFDTYHLPLARRRRAPAAVLAFLLHGVVGALFLWRSAALGPSHPEAGSGGEAGPAVRFLALPPPSVPVQVNVPAPAPISLGDVPSLEVLPTELGKIAIPLALGARAAPGGTGAGIDGAMAVDADPGTGGGAGYIFPASPRWAIIPPMNRPAAVRGRKYRVHFWVTAEGRVSRVEVEPDLPDVAYRSEFIERMMGYVFTPATTRNGERIASVYSITLTL